MKKPNWAFLEKKSLCLQIKKDKMMYCPYNSFIYLFVDASNAVTKIEAAAI